VINRSSFALITAFILSLTTPTTTSAEQFCYSTGVGFVHGLIDLIFNGGKYVAEQEKRLRECQEKERAERELEFSIGKSCKEAVRRFSRSPETLQFGSYEGKPYGSLPAYNLQKPFQETEGGWVTSVSGRDVSGGFYYRCFMDKQFRITHIQRLDNG